MSKFITINSLSQFKFKSQGLVIPPNYTKFTAQILGIFPYTFILTALIIAASRAFKCAGAP